MSKSEKVFGKEIVFDEMYYLIYVGGKRELPKKQQAEWNKTLYLPLQLQVAERNKIPLDNNPNVVPVTGRELMMFIRELKSVAFFDKFFDITHKIHLTSFDAYAYIKNNSQKTLIKRGVV